MTSHPTSPDWLRHWEPVPGYLDAPTMGLPPKVVTDALRRHLDDWSAGRCSATGFDEDVRRSRAAFARLVGVTPDDVAIGAQVSALVGLVAAGLPDGARVVVPAGDFASVVFPFLAHADRGVVVEQVPLERLAEAVRPGVDLVAFALAQSSDGRVADAGAVVAAARDAGALTLADLTQAAGWLPVDATRFDVTVTGLYKWLCAPRGSALLTASAEMRERIRPLYPNWYAAADPWASIYATEMVLADEVRRFDLSPAWPVWVGTAPALELVTGLHRDDPQVGAAVGRYGVGLADAVRREVRLPEEGRPVLSVPDEDGSRKAALERAGCRVSGRAGAVRIGFHLWNTEDDVDRVVEVLKR